MASEDRTRIKLGPGSQILEDAPENEELFAQIKNTEPVTALDLLKLALFYRSYPTNRPLADHLALLALGQIIELPSLQEAVKAAFLASQQSQNDGLDQFLDNLFGYDPRDPEDKDRPQFAVFTQTVLWVLFSGIGLLIESQTTVSKTDEEEITHYYVIGVSPDPAGLTIKTPTQRNL
jgi:hypothetical protein